MPHRVLLRSDTKSRATLLVGSQWKRAASFGMRAATEPRSAWLGGGRSRPRHAPAALWVLAALTLFLGAAAMPPMDATVLSGAGQLVQDSNLTQAAW